IEDLLGPEPEQHCQERRAPPSVLTRGSSGSMAPAAFQFFRKTGSKRYHTARWIAADWRNCRGSRWGCSRRTLRHTTVPAEATIGAQPLIEHLRLRCASDRTTSRRATRALSSIVTSMRFAHPWASETEQRHHHARSHCKGVAAW